MVFQPLFNYAAVKLDTAKEVSDGGIIIPDSVKSTPDYATVVAVGEKCPEVIKVGKKVLIVRGAGSPVVIDKENCLVLRCDETHSEILAVID